MNDNFKEAVREDAVRRARLEWFRQRVDQILRHVSAYDVLRQNGVDLKGSDGREEQFSCPFHGADNTPSARIYPETARSPSHAWCFVCQEKRWDAIGLWRKFNGGEGTPFGRVLTQIEQAYNLPQLEMPKDLGGAEARQDRVLEAFNTLYQAVENRLLLSRPAYKQLADMIGFLSASSVLDKLRHRVDEGQLDPARAVETLQQLLVRIREKVKACPEG